MANTEEGGELTRLHKERQVKISAVAQAAAFQQRGNMDLSDISGSFPKYFLPMTRIAAESYAVSAGLAESYVREYTFVESGEVIQIPKQVLAIRRFENNMRILADYGVKKRIKLGFSPEEAWELGAAQAEAYLSQAVLEAGRSTISNSLLRYRGKPGRFRRVTDGHPCAFCAMLAGRGPVYRSGTNFHTHNHCGCTLEPVLGGWEPNQQEALWNAAYVDAALDAESEFGKKWVRTAAGEGNILHRMRRRNPHLFHDGVFPEESPVRSQAYHSTVNARRERRRREQ